MLRRTGFLAASAAMGCWFACWTPEAAGGTSPVQTVMVASVASVPDDAENHLVLDLAGDSPWSIAEATGLEAPATWIDTGFVDLWWHTAEQFPHDDGSANGVVMVYATIAGDLGEANALGLLMQLNEDIGFVPLLHLEPYVAAFPAFSDANVMGDRVIEAGNDVTNTFIQRLKHPPEEPIGPGCLGLMCETPKGPGGWSPCTDPVMQVAANALDECRALAANWLLAQIVIATYVLAGWFAHCIWLGPLFAGACMGAALLKYLGVVALAFAAYHHEISQCWLAYKQAWQSQYAAACGVPPPHDAPIPGPGEPGFPQ